MMLERRETTDAPRARASYRYAEPLPVAPGIGRTWRCWCRRDVPSAPFLRLAAEKLHTCMCSRGLTFDHALALIVPSRNFRSPPSPPTRPAVAVRQIPFGPLLSWRDDAPGRRADGIT